MLTHDTANTIMGTIKRIKKQGVVSPFQMQYIYKNVPSTNKEAVQKYRTRLRMSVIGALGGCCVSCGFSDIRALQIDHINGGGNKLRKTSTSYYIKMYKEIIEGTHKVEVQLLCANCNWIKRTTNNEMFNNLAV